MLPLRNCSWPTAVSRGVCALAAALPLSMVLPGLPPPALWATRDVVATAGPPAAIAWFASARAEAPADKGKVRYTCPMHPHYISDHAGTCPICGMDLVKIETAAAAPTTPEMRQKIVIAPEVIQNMGVRIAPAERANFGRSIRATAMVMENERTRSVITARVEGWIEDLKITAVGDPVKEGMKLFELFAPELVVSQRDYLAAMREGNRRRLEDTETRLRAFGVQDQAIRKLAAEGREMQRLPFYADRNGVIADLPVVNGEYLKRGATVLRIQDYSTVWMVVNVAEKDLGLLSAKARANVTFPNLPGRTYETHVDYVYPTVDAKTRTGRVRLVVENKDGLIRPGSFADVSFDVDVEPRLAVRSEAVLRGERGTYVVIALGDGRFEPRPIATGLVAGGWTEVRKGISDGEQVVVSGQFLIDSESVLTESLRKIERLKMPLPLLVLDKTELAMVDHFVDAAIYLHEALVDGYDIEPKFLEPARQIKDLLWPRFGQTKLSFVIEDADKAIGEALTARSASEQQSALAKLAEALRPWMMEGAPKHYAEKNVGFFREDTSGRQWLQRGSRPSNPYGNAPAVLVPWPSKEPGTSEAAAPAASQPTTPAGHGIHAAPNAPSARNGGG